MESELHTEKKVRVCAFVPLCVCTCDRDRERGRQTDSGWICNRGRGQDRDAETREREAAAKALRVGNGGRDGWKERATEQKRDGERQRRAQKLCRNRVNRQKKPCGLP